MFKNALVSVSDRTGLVELLKPLAQQGMRIVTTQGTGQFLKQNAIPHLQVQDQTDFPEVMDGRVRTLHPRIHMALLARLGVDADEDILKAHGLEPFDLVVVNLYPFEKALLNNLQFSDLVEYIDIGGPALLRAAAKNFERITVVCDPLDYKKLNGNIAVDRRLRQEFAAKVFSHVSGYDQLIAKFLSESLPSSNSSGVDSSARADHLSLHQMLRYGENPHQKALWLKDEKDHTGLHTAREIQGKALSYNNILDLDAAVRLVRQLGERSCCVVVKHNNPCGVASLSEVNQEAINLAIARALNADPVSAFGGIVAISGEVDGVGANLLSKLFLECVIARSYTEEALLTLGKKPNLRVLEYDYPPWKNEDEKWENRNVSGGVLQQTIDPVRVWSTDWTDPETKLTESTRRDLELAWVVAAALKSNAIAIVEGGQTLGLGMGQVNRVDAVEHAIARARKFHPDRIARAVLASDAFFPFPDSVELLAEAGIKWVIQPGGSVKDEEVLKKAKDLEVKMVLTKERHFRH